jgi:hypothetical protein
VSLWRVFAGEDYGCPTRGRAVIHEGDIRPMWGGYRWYCSRGSYGASVKATQEFAERDWLHHSRRDRPAKD